MKKVVIYSTPSCTYCNLAKDFFKEHSIVYQEHNVATDIEKRKEMVEKSGQLGVPVIAVEDQVVVGFDEPTLVELLGIKSK
jgi:glutaredoxin 3